MLQYRGPFVLGLPEEAWFDMNMMQKDTRLALEMGHRLEVPLPMTAASNELLACLRSAHKRYGTTTALAGLDLEVRRGELLAILGPNGAGKSTAISLMLGLQRPDEAPR